MSTTKKTSPRRPRKPSRLIDRIRGKYAHVPYGSDDLVRDKKRELGREE